jgi:hypothetical protein
MDTKQTEEKLPFLKAKELRKKLDDLKEKKAPADDFLEYILRSLAQGKVDDPKAAAAIAYEIVQTKMHLRLNKKPRVNDTNTIVGTQKVFVTE